MFIWLWLLSYCDGSFNCCNKDYLSHKVENIYNRSLYREKFIYSWCKICTISYFYGPSKINELHCWLWSLIDTAWDLGVIQSHVCIQSLLFTICGIFILFFTIWKLLFPPILSELIIPISQGCGEDYIKTCSSTVLGICKNIIFTIFYSVKKINTISVLRTCEWKQSLKLRSELGECLGGSPKFLMAGKNTELLDHQHYNLVSASLKMVHFPSDWNWRNFIVHNFLIKYRNIFSSPKKTEW